MNTDLILQNVARHINLTDAEKKIFLSLLQSKTIKRRQTHLEDGEVCVDSTFVVQGALKGFTVDKNGIEHVMSFALPGWWIADMYSFISQKPGILNIEGLVDSEVLLLSRVNQQKLYEEVPKFERFYRILVENSLVASQQRLINNMSLAAEERYLHFTEKYPSIVEYAPQHSIASYLGITPEFLSKIRGRLARKPN